MLWTGRSAPRHDAQLLELETASPHAGRDYIAVDGEDAAAQVEVEVTEGELAQPGEVSGTGEPDVADAIGPVERAAFLDGHQRRIGQLDVEGDKLAINHGRHIGLAPGPVTGADLPLDLDVGDVRVLAQADHKQALELGVVRSFRKAGELDRANLAEVGLAALLAGRGTFDDVVFEVRAAAVRRHTEAGRVLRHIKRALAAWAAEPRLPGCKGRPQLGAQCGEVGLRQRVEHRLGQAQLLARRESGVDDSVDGAVLKCMHHLKYPFFFLAKCRFGWAALPRAATWRRMVGVAWRCVELVLPRKSHGAARPHLSVPQE